MSDEGSNIISNLIVDSFDFKSQIAANFVNFCKLLYTVIVDCLNIFINTMKYKVNANINLKSAKSRIDLKSCRSNWFVSDPLMFKQSHGHSWWVTSHLIYRLDQSLQAGLYLLMLNDIYQVWAHISKWLRSDCNCWASTSECSYDSITLRQTSFILGRAASE